MVASFWGKYEIISKQVQGYTYLLTWATVFYTIYQTLLYASRKTKKVLYSIALCFLYVLFTNTISIDYSSQLFVYQITPYHFVLWQRKSKNTNACTAIFVLPILQYCSLVSIFSFLFWFSFFKVYIRIDRKTLCK